MKIQNVVFCLIVFTVGLFIGEANSKVVEVEKIKKVRVPYLDMTDPELEKKLEIYANTLGLTILPLADRQAVEELHRKNINEIDKREHTIWQRGYIEGYRNARKRRW